MFKVVFLSIWIFLAVIFWPENAMACSCGAEPQTISEFLDKNDVVFEGQVIKREVGQTTFRVKRKYKNVPSKTITVNHPSHSCFGDFEQGKVFVVPAIRKTDQSLFTHLCMRDFSETDLRIYAKRNGNYTGVPDYCAVRIKSAYDYTEIVGGDFIVSEECQKFIPAFNERFR